MKLKIATWNVKRPRTSSRKNPKILSRLAEVNADILVLTETNSAIHPGSAYHAIATNALTTSKLATYYSGENRATIWSKFPASEPTPTYDPNTSVCTLIETEHGSLSVYGTIIGVLGNRRESFLVDLKKQIADWKRIAKTGPLCIIGDYNLTFTASYYFTKEGRELISECFEELNIKLLTGDLDDNIDHIAISKPYLQAAKPTTGVWNQDKELSDHKGVWLQLETQASA